MALNIIDVPIGPAKVEYGDTSPTIFDITKGGITFRVNTTKQDITVDQYGDTPVKSVMKGRTCEVKVPFALNDLEKLSKVTPNSKYGKSGTSPNEKKKLEVYAQAGFDLLKDAKKLVIKPTSSGTTENDWITIPIAGSIADPEYTYNADNERIANIVFVGYPDDKGLLYILGDASVVIA
ncbi:hypothetical protein ACFYKT_16690 [Cytobacillus sp. FJAT-53684]|uniref:Phage tail protein n=1 Tax=Cytobacillus mangrovibacter TaxID=3299024 RepID=A0ABW6K1I9_9BACI